MTLSPRAKLLLIMAIFALPIVASFTAYRFYRPRPTANHGELLLPPAQVSAQALPTPDGGTFSFASLQGRWALVVPDSGRCAEACREKLTTVRQVRLALGRNASRVARVFVVDDRRAPDPELMKAFEGTEVALADGSAIGPAARGDRAHVYLVDPNGNVMMRWPQGGAPKGMLQDLERLLKASQIG